MPGGTRFGILKALRDERNSWASHWRALPARISTGGCRKGAQGRPPGVMAVDPTVTGGRKGSPAESRRSRLFGDATYRRYEDEGFARAFFEKRGEKPRPYE